MSRARTRKEEEKIAFLSKNPELIEYDTNLSVVPNGDAFAVDARDGLGQPLPASLSGAGISPNLLTTTDAVELFDGDLFAPDEGSFVGLSDAGFGVAKPPESLDDGRVINDGQTLAFEVTGPFGPAAAALNVGFFGTGITDLLIEYEILNDEAGTITLEFEGAAGPFLHLGNGLPVPGPTPPVVIDVAAGSENTTGAIEVDAPYGAPFGGWDFTVDGDVDVAVTGISYGTNFDDIIII